MNSRSLGARLDALGASQKTTFQLIQRLSKLSFQPGTTPLDSGEGDVRLELGADIHQSLKDQDDRLELLKQEVEEYTGGVLRSRNEEKERERAKLGAQLARLVEDQKSARTQFRKAQLDAKRNAEAAKRKERELLFAGLQEGRESPGPGRRRAQEKLSSDELLVNASSDVTAALRKTHQLMQTELSRSQFAQETLEQSTAALSTLSESYSTLDTLLSSSRTLLSSLLRSQKSDTWYLETAFYILLSTVIWLIFRRFFYGPLWWLLWLPLKLTFKSLSGVFGAVGLLSGSGASTTISSTRSLIVKPSATGGPPKFRMGGEAPNIAVGVGGGGAKMRPPQDETRQPVSDPKSLSEEVGKIAEASNAQAQAASYGQTSSETGSGTQQERRPNPKKRMWEEDVERQKLQDGKKDEL